MDYLAVEASKREGTGKKAMKGLRKEGSIPAVLYGSGTNTNLSVKPMAVSFFFFLSSQLSIHDLLLFYKEVLGTR